MCADCGTLVPELVTALREARAEVERLRLESSEWEYAAIENGGRLTRLSNEVDRAIAEAAAARAAIARVRELHTPTCEQLGNRCTADDTCPVRICTCGDDWPCPTVGALDSPDGDA